MKETASKHFRGADNLLLIAIEANDLGPTLKWEPSRGGALFPHLYDTLALSTVQWVKDLALGDDGLHDFPEGN